MNIIHGSLWQRQPNTIGCVLFFYKIDYVCLKGITTHQPQAGDHRNNTHHNSSGNNSTGIMMASVIPVILKSLVFTSEKLLGDGRTNCQWAADIVAIIGKSSHGIGGCAAEGG